MLVLDTNIIIYYLKGNDTIAEWLENRIIRNETLAVSVLSVVELLGYKNITATERIDIQRLLSTILIIDVDTHIAQEAGRIREQYQTGTVDAVIAATAKILSAELVTNDKNLRKILGVKITSIIN